MFDYEHIAATLAASLLKPIEFGGSGPRGRWTPSKDAQLTELLLFTGQFLPNWQ
jgi:hypothetical protein